jgi:hypothetical protein
MNLQDERFIEACNLLSDFHGIPVKRVTEMAWIGIIGQAQAGVFALGIPLCGMTEDERLDYFVAQAGRLVAA